MSARTDKAEAMRLALADLKRSGLDKKQLRPSTGISALTASEALARAPKCSWWRSAPEGLACLLFDYLDFNGQSTGIWRLRRLEDPPKNAFGTCPKLDRYTQGAGTRPGVWLPRSVDWQRVLADSTLPIVLVEGEKKAEALCQKGIPTIGLGGIWSTGSRAQGIEILPELVRLSTSVSRSKRPCIILYDNDPKSETRETVKRAATRLGTLLRRQGADIRVAHLPLADAASKVGADDFLVAQGVKKLREVIEAAESLELEALTDVGLARRFAAQATGDFLYSPKRKQWLVYDGRRWDWDSSAQVRELTVEVVEDLLLETCGISDPAKSQAVGKFAFASQRRERLAAMLDVAPDAVPALKVNPEELDVDPWLLNVLNGTIDLRTGELRPHDPDDRITHLAPVVYAPEARSPLWEKTLREIFPSQEVREFSQRSLGYALTGSVREEKLFFFHGLGRNGKNVVIDTVEKVLGDYAARAPESLLLLRKFNEHSTELMTLFGKRLVIASEVGQGQSWNGSRVKALTSTDRIKARAVYENHIEFPPTHKFVVLANSCPRARAEDFALWARLKLVPFEQTFYGPSDEKPVDTAWLPQNMKLKEKLLEELSGILTWLVTGCLAWQRDGLKEPAAVRKATADYRDDQLSLEPIGPFMRGQIIPPKGVPLQTLKDDYNLHAAMSGRNRKLTPQEFAEQLRALKYRTKLGHAGKTMVLPPLEPAPDRDAKVIPITGTTALKARLRG